MADTPSLKVTKEFNTRGGRKAFSNRYHFDGDSPTTEAKWVTLANAVVNAEKAIYERPGDDDFYDVTIVKVDCYDAGSDAPVHTVSYATVGTGAFTAYGPVPGDAAALIRYSTTQRTAHTNHPIYLFNYYHGCWCAASSPDVLNASQKTAIEAYGTAWLAGFSDGDITHKRAGPRGAVAQARFVEPYITHRDFPR